MRPAAAWVILRACLAAPARAEGPAPARAKGRPVDALRAACARAFEEGRHAEAVEACHRAEALGRSPRHLLFEGQALRRLGKVGEARAICSTPSTSSRGSPAIRAPTSARRPPSTSRAR
jgi:predicted ATPase